MPRCVLEVGPAGGYAPPMTPPIHPNVMTAARLPLAPVAVAALAWGHHAQQPAGIVIAAILSLILEITDLADGWIARRYNVVSDFGKLFDPFADAFCRFTLFLGLYAIDQADLWMILIIFYRDSSIAFLRSVAATKQIVLAARTSGKIKAVVQGVGTQVCYLALVIPAFAPSTAATLHDLPWWTMLGVTIVTGWSWVDYMAGAGGLLRAAWNDGSSA